MKDKIDILIEDKIYLPIFAPIEKAIFDAIGIDYDILINKNRFKHYVYARIIFCHLCREKGITMEIIGRRIKRNHSTITHLVAQYDGLYQYDKIFKVLANAVLNELKKIENGI